MTHSACNYADNCGVSIAASPPNLQFALFVNPYESSPCRFYSITLLLISIIAVFLCSILVYGN